MKISRERIDEITYWKSKRPYVRDLLIAIDERDELLHRMINPRNHDWIRPEIMAAIWEFLRGSRFEVK